MCALFSRPIFVSARLSMGLHVQPLRRRSDRLLASSSHFNGFTDSGCSTADSLTVPKVAAEKIDAQEHRGQIDPWAWRMLPSATPNK